MMTVQNNTQLVEDIHNNIIIPIGERKMSFDEGFAKVMKMTFHINTMISISFSQRKNYLMYLSARTYEYMARCEETYPDEEYIQEGYDKVIDYLMGGGRNN